MSVISAAALDHNGFAIDESGNAPATVLGPVNTCFASALLREKA
jgi:hypothetical protein